MDTADQLFAGGLREVPCLIAVRSHRTANWRQCRASGMAKDGMVVPCRAYCRRRQQRWQV